MRSFILFLASVGLALWSFTFARNHWLMFHEQPIVNPLFDPGLFGSWIRDEWTFAIAVPLVLILGGLYVSTRR